VSKHFACAADRPGGGCAGRSPRDARYAPENSAALSTWRPDDRSRFAGPVPRKGVAVISAGRSSDSRAWELLRPSRHTLLADNAAMALETATQISTRTQRRGRPGFTPGSLFAGLPRRAPRPPNTSHKSNMVRRLVNPGLFRLETSAACSALVNGRAPGRKEGPFCPRRRTGDMSSSGRRCAGLRRLLETPFDYRQRTLMRRACRAPCPQSPSLRGVSAFVPQKWRRTAS
jgi:hypothetical protein